MNFEKENCIGCIVSNFDHQISTEVQRAVKNSPGNVWAEHPAWNFYGKVWHDGLEFKELVMVHGVEVDTLSCESFAKLLEMVNERFGCD